MNHRRTPSRRGFVSDRSLLVVVALAIAAAVAWVLAFVGCSLPTETNRADTSITAAEALVAVDTRHGRVYVDSRLDPVETARYLNQGVDCAATRTSSDQVAAAVRGASLEGLIVHMGDLSRGPDHTENGWSTFISYPFVAKHEVQHVEVRRIQGFGSERTWCAAFQDHSDGQQHGADADGYDLDCAPQWGARRCG